MDRLRAAFPRGGEDRGGLQIALARRRRPDAHSLVRQSDMQRARIGIGVHRNRCDPELLRRANDAARDLAAIGNQKGLEHCPVF